MAGWPPKGGFLLVFFNGSWACLFVRLDPTPSSNGGFLVLFETTHTKMVVSLKNRQTRMAREQQEIMRASEWQREGAKPQGEPDANLT